MSCIHITASQFISSTVAFPTQSFRLSKFTSATPRCPRAPVVCLFGGKGKSESGNEGSPWKALENAMDNFKKNQSIEDVLRQQIEKQDYPDDGGSIGGSAGGGGSDGDGFGEGEDEGFPGMLDEFVQAILATMGFIFLYIYILEGEEITVIARDSLRFLFTRQKSIRLSRLINQWTGFLERMKEKEEFDPYWLERAIITTPTWYDSTDKYKYVFKVLNRTSVDDDDHVGDVGDVDDAYDE